MTLAVYPGSFDPITNGHIDILEKTSKIFDRIVVAVVHNVNKKALFDLEERVQLIKATTSHLKNIEVDYFNGLLINYMHNKQANVIIRGLRNVADFEYEMHMGMMNKKIAPDIDTIFVMSDSNFTYVSSSIVKEVALLNGNVEDLVPKIVNQALINKRAMLTKE